MAEKVSKPTSWMTRDVGNDVTAGPVKGVPREGQGRVSQGGHESVAPPRACRPSDREEKNYELIWVQWEAGDIIENPVKRRSCLSLKQTKADQG